MTKYNILKAEAVTVNRGCWVLTVCTRVLFLAVMLSIIRTQSLSCHSALVFHR